MKANPIFGMVLLVLITGLMTTVPAGADFPGTPLDIGTLPPGKSITITYEVTVNANFPTPDGTVCAQGLVSGNNFLNTPTDDPDTGSADDPTCTPVTGGVPVELSRFSIE